MKNSEHEKSLSLRSVFHLSLRHFTLAILATIVLSGCNSGGGGDGSAGNNSPTNSTTAVIASGTVDSNGGVVADPLTEAAVIVAPGAVSAATSITVEIGTDKDGHAFLRFKSSAATAAPVNIVLPDPLLLQARVASSANTTTNNGLITGITTSGSVLQVAGVNTTAAVGVSYFANPYFSCDPQVGGSPQTGGSWYRRCSYFWKSTNGIGVGNRIDDRDVAVTLNEGGFDVTLAPASVMGSICDYGDTTCLRENKKAAVLFVHGFLAEAAGENNFGGGQSTWGTFPILFYGANYVPFEFRWVTGARFEDVAADLCRTVDQIAEQTGKQVHIVAHSFGGVLTRVYLQGTGKDKVISPCAYRGNVASVTTIGSPHSGIFDTPTLVMGNTYPVGQDGQETYDILDRYTAGSLQTNGCQQLSCYQMGEYVNLSKWNNWAPVSQEVAADIFRVKRTPGEIAVGLFETKNQLPAVPLQVLIGLTTTRGLNTVMDMGDGLISYEGQRFLPTDTGSVSDIGSYQTLRGGVLIGSAAVTERVLGFSTNDVRPGYNSPLNSDNPQYVGYRHTGFPVGPGEAWRMAYTECISFDTCLHDSVVQAKAWTDGNVATAASSPPRFVLRVRVLDEASGAPLRAPVEVRLHSVPVSDVVVPDVDGYASISIPFQSWSSYDLVWCPRYKLHIS